MKSIFSLLVPLMVTFILHGCSTVDVDGEQPFQVDPNIYYELSDAAFAEFLDYNAKIQTTANNKMPEGIVFRHEGKWYLSKELASTVTTPKIVYLTQSVANITALKDAGYSGNYIKSIDGIQFFTEATSIYLTDTDVEGKLDLTALTKLSVLQARRTNINELLLPPTMTDVRCEPKAGATDDQKLKALDLSACTGISNILLNVTLIPKANLLLPENPTAAITATLTGATGVPYPCSQAFYDKLADAASKAFFKVAGVKDLYQLTDLNFAIYLKYNMKELAEGAEYKLPEGLIVDGMGVDAGKFFLDKDVALTATAVGINQANGWDTPIKDKGYNVTGKIINIDGIQFFKNITKLSMTSGAVTGTLDLSGLTKLETLFMNSNLCTTVVLPASVTQFNYDASSTATVDQKLTAINFSKCKDLQAVSLKDQTITTFNEPESPTKTNISIDLSGNVPTDQIEVSASFYNLLSDPSKIFFKKAFAPTAGTFSIVWDPTDFSMAGSEGGTTPWAYKSSLSAPSNLMERGITGAPEIIRTAEAFASKPSQTNNFCFRIADASKQSSAEAAATNNQYASVKITNTATSSLNLKFSNISTTVWRSGAGVDKIDVQYSVNNGGSYMLLSTITVPVATSQGNATGSVAQNIDLSSIPAITPGGQVIIRLVPWNTSSTGSTGTSTFASAQTDAPVKTFSINGSAVQP